MQILYIGDYLVFGVTPATIAHTMRQFNAYIFSLLPHFFTRNVESGSSKLLTNM